MQTKVYVGNLSYDTTEGEIAALFAQAGTVVVAEMQFEVDVEALNVRNGPGLEFTIIGQLSKGKKVSGNKLNSRSAWIEIEPGKWCALVHDGKQYLKLKK